VSIEPYPTPNQIELDLDALLEAVAFIDHIIFGRTNHNKEVASFKHHKEFYSQAAAKVIDFCNAKGISCHIKMALFQILLVNPTNPAMLVNWVRGSVLNTILFFRNPITRY